MISGMTSTFSNANYKNKAYSSAERKTKLSKSICYASDRVQKIDVIDSSLAFYSPILFGYKIEDGLYCADYNAGGLIIAAAEESLEEMIMDMKLQFKHAWEYYALESDDRLNEGAKKVKNWLINRMRSL